MADSEPADPSVVVVGVCGAGKSTLVAGLRAVGCPARVCVQEHSYVPTLWRRRGRPRALIYLHASLEAVCRRRQVRWDESALTGQRARLAGARAACDLYIDTDGLSAAQVLERAVAYLRGLDPPLFPTGITQ